MIRIPSSILKEELLHKRLRGTSPNSPRIYSEKELLDLARELGRQMAREAHKKSQESGQASSHHSKSSGGNDK